MSKQYYLAAIADFCNMKDAIKKLEGIDVIIRDDDVVLSASDIRTEVPLGLSPEMSFSVDKLKDRLAWGFSLIQNFREWSTLFSMEGGEVQYRIRGDRTVEIQYPSCSNLSEYAIVSLMLEKINDRLQLHKVSDCVYDIEKVSETENVIIFPITSK